MYRHKNKSTGLICNSNPKIRCLQLSSHLGRQGGAVSRGDIAAAIAGADGARVVLIIVEGIPVVLGHVADAGSLGGADGHVVGVASRVHDGRQVVAASAIVEVGLSPSGIERAGGLLLGGGLGPADLGVLLEGDDLVLTRGESEGQDRGLGGNGGTQVGLDAVALVEGLVPDDDGHVFSGGVDEVVGVLPAVSGVDLDDVRALRATDVATLADIIS